MESARNVRKYSQTRCLFCTRTTSSFSRARCGLDAQDEGSAFSWILRDDNSNNVSLSNEARSYLQSQVKAVFVARKLLDVPVEKCAEYLGRSDGEQDPATWLSVCESCNEDVEEGYKIYCEIAQLNSRLEEVKRKLKGWILTEGSITAASKNVTRTRKKSGGLKVENFVYLDIRNYVLAANRSYQTTPDLVRRSPRKRKTFGASADIAGHRTSSFTESPDSPESPDQYHDDADVSDYQPEFCGVPSKKPRESPGDISATGKNEIAIHIKSRMLRVETPYYCDNCHMIFTSLPQLCKHIELYHSDAPKLPCNMCDGQFETKQLLEMHYEDDHSAMETEKATDSELETQDEKPHVCPHCSDTFPSILKRDYHIAKFHKDKLLTCKLCSHKFKKYCYLLKHDRKRHEQIGLKCDESRKAFDTSNSLRNDISLAHYVEPSNGAPVREKCNEPIHGKAGRLQILGIRTKTYKKKNRYKCSMCCAHYSSDKLAPIRLHLSLHDETKGIPCPQCGWFCEKDKLHIHTKHWHPGRSREGRERIIREQGGIPYYCDNCHLIFPSILLLLRHLKKCHAKAPKHFCKFCDRECETKQLLELHCEEEHPTGEVTEILRVHEPKDEKFHGCSYCSMEFPTILKRDYHIAKHHKDKILICALCGHKFKTYFNLAKHDRQRHQQMGFDCKACSKTFDSMEALTRHMSSGHSTKVSTARSRIKLNVSEMLPNDNSNSESKIEKQSIKKQKRKSPVEKPEESIASAAMQMENNADASDATVAKENDCNRVAIKASNEELRDKNGSQEIKMESKRMRTCRIHHGVIRETSILDTGINSNGRSDDDSSNSHDDTFDSDWEPVGNDEALVSEEDENDDSSKNEVERDQSLEQQSNPPFINTNQDSKREADTSKSSVIIRPKLMFHCDSCIATYKSMQKSLIDIHQRLHGENIGKPCPYCGWLCEENKLRSHINYRHPGKRGDKMRPSKRAREVKLGKKRLKNIDNYKYKFLRVEQPYYCDSCHMIYTTEHRLIEHRKLYHPNAQTEVCSICDLPLETKQILELHMRDSHPNEKSTLTQKEPEEPEVCTHCEKSFPSKLKRDYHIAKSHMNKLLTCALCNHQFKKFKSLFYHHKQQHQNEKFMCEKCPKSFSQAHYLKFHMSTVHHEELLEPLACKECNVTFVSSAGLRMHMEAVHQKVKLHCCEYCGKAFSRLGDLGKHVLLHTAPPEKRYKQGPFYCQFCQAKFNVRQALYYHLKRLHSNKYEFKCDNCGTGYLTQNTLLQHLRKCKAKVTKSSSPADTQIQ